MFWFYSHTLNVTEWKTVTPKVWIKDKGRCKAEWWNQGLLYAYIVNLNEISKRERIKVNVEVWINNDSIENISKRNLDAVFSESLT